MWRTDGRKKLHVFPIVRGMNNFNCKKKPLTIIQFHLHLVSVYDIINEFTVCFHLQIGNWYLDALSGWWNSSTYATSYMAKLCQIFAWMYISLYKYFKINNLSKFRTDILPFIFPFDIMLLCNNNGLTK